MAKEWLEGLIGTNGQPRERKKIQKHKQNFYSESKDAHVKSYHNNTIATGGTVNFN